MYDNKGSLNDLGGSLYDHRVSLYGPFLALWPLQDQYADAVRIGDAVSVFRKQAELAPLRPRVHPAAGTAWQWWQYALKANHQLQGLRCVQWKPEHKPLSLASLQPIACVCSVPKWQSKE